MILLLVVPFYKFFHTSGGSGGQAIFSKEKISSYKLLNNDSDNIPGSWFPIGVYEVKIGNNKRKIRIVNVHLRPPLEENGTANLFSAWRTNPIRLEEVKYLESHLEEYKDSIPTVILGDFNENDDNTALKYLEDLGYKDGLKENVPKGRETHRWPLWIFTLKKKT